MVHYVHYSTLKERCMRINMAFYHYSTSFIITVRLTTAVKFLFRVDFKIRGARAQICVSLLKILRLGNTVNKFPSNISTAKKFFIQQFDSLGIL